MTVTITGDELEAKVRKIMSASPEFQYQMREAEKNHFKCEYERDNMGSCAFGRALQTLGVPLAELKKMDKLDSAGIDDIILGYFEEHEESSGMIPDINFVNVSPRQTEFFRTLQNHQDNGTPWGRCIELAELDTIGRPL